MALRPVADVLQRLEYDKGVDATRFTFYFREAQLPVKVGAAWGDANDRVNGTERMLAKAIPQHRIAFVSYGQRLVWHRGRRVDVPCAVIHRRSAPSHAFLLGEQNGRAAVLRARGMTRQPSGGAPRDRSTPRVARERAGVLASSARVRRSYKPPTSC